MEPSSAIESLSEELPIRAQSEIVVVLVSPAQSDVCPGRGFFECCKIFLKSRCRSFVRRRSCCYPQVWIMKPWSLITDCELDNISG